MIDSNDAAAAPTEDDLFHDYQLGAAYDEMFEGRIGRVLATKRSIGAYKVSRQTIAFAARR